MLPHDITSYKVGATNIKTKISGLKVLKA